MKILLLFLITAAALPCFGQSSAEDFNREAAISESLSVKLFPDTAVSSSQLVQEMELLDQRLKTNGSSLFNYSGKPLVLSFEAAGLLKISPHWENLKPEEVGVAVNELGAALISTRDFNRSPGQIAQVPAPATMLTPTLAPPSQHVGVEAYHAFLQSLIDQGRGYIGHRRIDEHSVGLVYLDGPLDGMTKDQVEAYAQQQWQLLSAEQQLAYEQKAQQFGDPIAKQEELDREEAAHPSGATVYNSDGTVSQVQYH